jgi:vitamin B12 transporter
VINNLKKADIKAIAGAVYLNMGTQMPPRKAIPTLMILIVFFNGKSEKFNYFAALNSTRINRYSEAKPAAENIALRKMLF